MNKVILSGNLCKDNELRYSQAGTAILNQTIAVRREYKNASGEYDSDFINIVIYNQQAEYINTYAPKGSKVELVGRWCKRNYQDSTGATKYIDECVVENISILQSTLPKEATQQTQAQPPQTFDMYTDDGDLPF